MASPHGGADVCTVLCRRSCFSDQFAREFHHSGSRPSSRQGGAVEHSPIYPGSGDVSQRHYYQTSYADVPYSDYAADMQQQPVPGRCVPLAGACAAVVVVSVAGLSMYRS